jgi:hypothetical protein
MYGHNPKCGKVGSIKHLRGRVLFLDIDIEGRIILKLMLKRIKVCVPQITG